MIDFVFIGGIIADIILVLVFAMSISLGYRKGFTVLVFNLICLIITVIAVTCLCKPITTFIYENTNLDEFFSKHIKNATEDFLEEQIEKNGHINTGKTNIARPIAEKINSYIDEAEEKGVSSASKYVANKLSYIAISAIVLILLCIIVRSLTIFLRAFLFFLTELPIISSLDTVGGVIYGII